MTLDKIVRLRDLIHKAAESLSDEDALDGIEMFPVWIYPYAYQEGDRRKWAGKLYKCVQAHTSQEDWAPDVAKALWIEVSIDEWPEWIQPTGAHDAYSEGAKVTHNGLHWISDTDENVWEPGVYGWTVAS